MKIQFRHSSDAKITIRDFLIHSRSCKNVNISNSADHIHDIRHSLELTPRCLFFFNQPIAVALIQACAYSDVRRNKVIGSVVHHDISNLLYIFVSFYGRITTNHKKASLYCTYHITFKIFLTCLDNFSLFG